MARVKVIWDLTKPLPDVRINEKIVVKLVGKNQLKGVGKTQVITWGGFIKDPETHLSRTTVRVLFLNAAFS